MSGYKVVKSWSLKDNDYNKVEQREYLSGRVLYYIFLEGEWYPIRKLVVDLRIASGVLLEDIDIEKLAWEKIKAAAAESVWIPKEYFMNDWVSDVCNFLKNGPDKSES